MKVAELVMFVPFPKLSYHIFYFYILVYKGIAIKEEAIVVFLFSLLYLSLQHL